MSQMPAITLVATPGRRARMVELCQEAEKRGFSGIYVPSLAAALQFCQSVLEELPMEFALEARALLAVSLEGAVG